MGSDAAFWEVKRLDEMTREEWEKLCDGCGWCCMHKFEDPDSGRVAYTCISCRLFDPESCRCRSYRRRKQLMPGCLVLTPAIAESHWLPHTCAYRVLAEGRRLPSWHPLVSGSANTVHAVGASVRGLAVSERWIHPEDLGNFILADGL
jgi:uncharacterized cysteine cluster protein YcgN (CxxCxxCC family)